MNRDLLHAVGEALYGPRWLFPLARDLGVADRTVRRWASGIFGIPPGVSEDCVRLVGERIDTLRDLGEHIKHDAESGTPPPQPGA